MKVPNQFVCNLIGPRSVPSPHSPVSRTARRVRLRMRTSFPSALPTLCSHGYQSRGRVGSRYHEPSVPHIGTEATCSSPVPPNAPVSRQRSFEYAVLLRMLRHGIDRPSSRSFPVHSLCISDTQGRTRWEGSSPRLCPADHSAGISHSRPRLTAARGCSCRYVRLRGSLAPPRLGYPSTTCCCRRHIPYIT